MRKGFWGEASQDASIGTSHTTSQGETMLWLGAAVSTAAFLRLGAAYLVRHWAYFTMIHRPHPSTIDLETRFWPRTEFALILQSIIREQEKDWCADWKKNTQSDFVSLCGVRGGSHRFAIYRNTIPLCPHSSFTTLAMDFSIFIVPVDIIESEYGKPFVCRGMIGKGPAVLRPLFDITDAATFSTLLAFWVPCQRIVRQMMMLVKVCLPFCALMSWRVARCCKYSNQINQLVHFFPKSRFWVQCSILCFFEPAGRIDISGQRTACYLCLALFGSSIWAS